MANGNSIPTQVRAVDPFASYNSDTVNKLTRMLTYGDALDGLSRRGACEVILDSTSSTRVIVTPGDVYKDDVWISITNEHAVDFTEANEYYNFDTGFDEIGWYYVVLDYTYQKQRPAPEASILILKPSQRSAYSPGGAWLFLKAVYVDAVGPGNISTVSSYDPTPGYEHSKRRYVAKYAGTDVFLPTFNPRTDQARLLYVESEDEYYFGYSDRWGGAGGGGGSVLDISTTGFQEGDLVYVTSSGTIGLANSSLGVTTADGVVVRVGTPGRIQMSGRVEDVKVEQGETVSVGNLLYLSKTDPGTVTTQKTTPFHQFVGRCVNVQDSTTVTILFVRGEPGGGTGIADLATYIYEFIDSTSWISSGSQYYVDISDVDIAEGRAVIQIWDDATKETIIPSRIDNLNSVTRVWMPVNTKSLHFLAIGPSATTRLSSNVIDVTQTINPVDWQGAGPYYYDVDVSTIENTGAVILVKDVNSNEIIEPQNVVFDSTNTVRIFMPTSSETLEVIAMGPTTAVAGTSLIGLNLTLASGVSWIPDSGLYYQEISLVTFEDSDVTMSFVDADTKQYIYPTLVDFIDGDTTARIWMPDDTKNINVTIIG